MKVLKFGGSSVGSVNSILSVKKIVEAVEEPVIVVVSALGGITDKLIHTSEMAANGDAANLDLFHLPKHHAFSGELTAIVTGNCTLTATAKGLKKAIIKIE